MKRYTLTVVDVRTDEVVRVAGVDTVRRIKPMIIEITGEPYKWCGAYAVYIRDNFKEFPQNLDIDEWAEHLMPDEVVEFFGPKAKMVKKKARQMPAGVIAALAAARDSLYDDMDMAENDGKHISLSKYNRYTDLLDPYIIDNTWPAHAEELARVCREMIAKTKERAAWAKADGNKAAADSIKWQADLFKQGLEELKPFIAA